MLLDKFSKAPKFISQMIKVYIFSGKYLWLLPCFISYVESLWKKSVKKIFLCTRLWQGLGVSRVGAMVVVQLTKKLQRLSCAPAKP